MRGHRWQRCPGGSRPGRRTFELTTTLGLLGGFLVGSGARTSARGGRRLLPGLARLHGPVFTRGPAPAARAGRAGRAGRIMLLLEPVRHGASGDGVLIVKINMDPARDVHQHVGTIQGHSMFLMVRLTVCFELISYLPLCQDPGRATS